MRIWIINHYAGPPTTTGGTRHYDFAKQLIKRGHEVIIIAANYSHLARSYILSNASQGQVDTTDVVPFLWIPTPAYQGNTFSRFWNMLVFSIRILQKKYVPVTTPPDIIIGSNPHLFAALSAAILAKRFKKPFILEIRDLWPESLVDLGRISNYHPLIIVMRLIEKYLYKRADKIISLLPAANAYFVKHGVKLANILWLPNAIDIDNVATALPSESQNKFTVMYAGAHGVANDLDTVLKAAKILQGRNLADSIHICLIGDGPEKSRLQAYALSQNIKIVEFIAAVPKTKIYHLLKKADVFLMLLKASPVFRWGISPNKLFDYLMMARPVIFGVETPYNPIEKSQAGISIKPSDPESLAQAIYHLSCLPKIELTKMGMRGKEFVLQHHHLQKLTDSLENLIMETA